MSFSSDSNELGEYHSRRSLRKAENVDSFRYRDGDRADVLNLIHFFRTTGPSLSKTTRNESPIPATDPVRVSTTASMATMLQHFVNNPVPDEFLNSEEDISDLTFAPSGRQPTAKVQSSSILEKIWLRGRSDNSSSPSETLETPTTNSSPGSAGSNHNKRLAGLRSPLLHKMTSFQSLRRGPSKGDTPSISKEKSKLPVIEQEASAAEEEASLGGTHDESRGRPLQSNKGGGHHHHGISHPSSETSSTSTVKPPAAQQRKPRYRSKSQPRGRESVFHRTSTHLRALEAIRFPETISPENLKFSDDLKEYAKARARSQPRTPLNSSEISTHRSSPLTPSRFGLAKTFRAAGQLLSGSKKKRGSDDFGDQAKTPALPESPSPSPAVPSPASVQRARKERNEESLEILREDLRERFDLPRKPVPHDGSPHMAHPKHPFEWNTKNLWCAQCNEPRTPPGSYFGGANPYLATSPYSMPPSTPISCDLCGASCCVHGDMRLMLASNPAPLAAAADGGEAPTQAAGRQVLRRLEALQALDSIESLFRTGKDFSTFLQCGEEECSRIVCPGCAHRCCEAMCGMVFCSWCRDTFPEASTESNPKGKGKATPGGEVGGRCGLCTELTGRN